MLGARLSGVACVRALAQRERSLPPAVRARLLVHGDAPGALVGALRARPWGAPGAAFLAGSWRPGPPPAPLHPCEAHCWLALLWLLHSRACTAEGRAACATRAAALLTPAALAALPALSWLQRVAQAGPDGGDGGEGGCGLLVRLVAPWRPALQRVPTPDWGATRLLADDAAARWVVAQQARVWDDTLPAGDEQQATGGTGAHSHTTPGGAPFACVLVTFTHTDGETAAELRLDATTAPAEEVAPPPGRAHPVQRWRLAAAPVPGAALPLRRLPPRGRVSVQLGVGGPRAEAVLTLPALAWAAAPDALWLAVGTLETDGFSAQVRLGRVPAPQAAAVDARTGLLALYRPTGKGFLTVSLVDNNNQRVAQ